MRELPGFGMNVFEAGALHFLDSPGNRFSGFRGTGDASADVVAKLAKIFVGIGLHHSGASDRAKRFKSGRV